MSINLYSRLHNNSRKAISRKRTKFGNPYLYRPRGDLLKRLARETGLTPSQVHEQLLRERAELLRRNAE